MKNSVKRLVDIVLLLLNCIYSVIRALVVLITYPFLFVSKLILISLDSEGSISSEKSSNDVSIWISNKIKEVKQKYIKKKEIDEYTIRLKKCISSKNNFISSSNVARFVLISTFLLQLTSFFTTLDGTKYYFSAIPVLNETAALFITLVIQGNLFLLANLTINRQTMKRGKMLALVVFCLISIFFSYTGLINLSQIPIKELKREYSEFYDYYDLMLLKASSSGSTYINLDLYFEERYNSMIKALEGEIASKEALIVNSKDSTSTNRITGIDRYGNPVITTQSSTTNNQNRAEAVAIRDKLNNLKDALNDQYTKIINLPIDKKLNAIINDLEDKYKDSDGKEIKIKSDLNSNNDISCYLLFISAYNQANSELNNTDNNLPSLSKLYDYKVTGNMYDNYIVRKYDDIVSGIKVNQKNSNYLVELKNAFNDEITEKYQKSPLSNTTNEIDGIEKEQLDILNNYASKVSEQKDFNVLAISYLFDNNGEYFTSAIGYLVFAVFVDSMTVFIPCCINTIRKSFLFIKSRKEVIYEEEQILETLISTINPLEEQNDFNKIKDKLKSLVEIFEYSSIGINEGYGLRCKREVFDNYVNGIKGEGMMAFIVFIRSCNYIYDELDVSLFEDDVNKYVYLRSKFYYWIQDVISSIEKYNSEKE